MKEGAPAGKRLDPSPCFSSAKKRRDRLIDFINEPCAKIFSIKIKSFQLEELPLHDKEEVEFAGCLAEINPGRGDRRGGGLCGSGSA